MMLGLVETTALREEMMPEVGMMLVVAMMAPLEGMMGVVEMMEAWMVVAMNRPATATEAVMMVEEGMRVAMRDRSSDCRIRNATPTI
jgi:hypothetical protein